MHSIDRQLLRKALNLPERLDLDYAGEFFNVSVPLGYTFIEDPPGSRRYRRQALGSMTADVIVRASASFIRNGKRVKVSKHRIFIICPECERHIPAGRWGQHAPCK